MWELETVVGDCHGLGGQQPPSIYRTCLLGDLAGGVGATAPEHKKLIKQIKWLVVSFR